MNKPQKGRKEFVTVHEREREGHTTGLYTLSGRPALQSTENTVYVSSEEKQRGQV